MDYFGNEPPVGFQGQLNPPPYRNPFNQYSGPQQPYVSAFGGHHHHAMPHGPLPVAFPNYQPYHQKRPFNSGNPGFVKTKKLKKDPIFVDFCDVCDRGFKTLQKKKEHYEQHVKCHEENCEFEAHFKIVEIHKRNVHGPNGLKLKLETPEDIKKWREERRKKFPTQARLKEKLTEETERYAAGAVLACESFGKFRRGRGVARGRGGRGFRRGAFRGDFRTTSNCVNVDTPSVPVTSDDKVYKNEGNPLDLLVGADNKSVKDEASDGEIEPTAQPSVQTTGKGVGGLSQLMVSYGSDEDSVDESDVPELGTDKRSNVENALNVVQSVEDQAQEATNGSTQQSSSPALSSPLEVSSKKNKMSDKTRQNAFRQSRPNKRQKNKPKNTYQSRLSRPSLLRKLLEPEMRQERNDILQCVRYLVERNFFDESQAK